jgi:hypothetical protein
MKIQKLHKKLLATAAGTLLALGLASQAYASPVFTVSPPALIGTGTFSNVPLAPFSADFIHGQSSELLQITSPTQLTATSGWLQFTSFSLGAANIASGSSGLDFKLGSAPNTLTGYQLYLTFTLVADLTSGTLGGANSTYNLSSLNFNVYLDPNYDTTFTNANATTATGATVSTGLADTLLGSGSIKVGTAGFDSLGGAYLNSLVKYLNTAAGNAYFTAPVPFYTLAFNEFNNTTQGVIDNTALGLISITNASGGTDFTIPEPETLALMGLGLLSMGVSLRKRKAA